jgi:hypothetical protein
MLPQRHDTIRKASCRPVALRAPEGRQEWRIFTSKELTQRCRELDSGKYLINDLLPKQSLSIAVGDSGVGKSPLFYQAAICVAAGVPFLGHSVSRGRVLYLDFENGLSQVQDLISRVTLSLGLPKIPEDLLLWNYNDAPENWTRKSLAAMVKETNADWIIIDSLTGYAPEIEEKTSFATRTYQEFRKIMRASGASVTGIHHLRKPSSKAEDAPPPLQEDPHQWFYQARGARALVNATDVRIGIDRFGRANHTKTCDGQILEVALVIGGFGRVRGSIPATFVGRVLDEGGDALGYEKIAGVTLLFNSEQEKTYQALPERFRFKDAQQLYDRGPQATSDFLKKCANAGIVRKVGTQYAKVRIVERTE